MTTKLSPHQTRTSTPESLPDKDRPLPEEAMTPSAEDAEAVETETGEEHESDPYDALWDPNMDTRPERIRKTRARREFRPKGGGPGRGRRRESP
jgi:hypothetical protein